MTFNIDRDIVKQLFTIHPSNIDDDIDVIEDITDNLYRLNLPNTQLMERIVKVLEDNYNIWYREDFIDWFTSNIRFDLEKNNIPIYIGQLYDEDEPGEFEVQVDEALTALKAHSVVYHLRSDDDYFEVIYFDKSIEDEGFMMLQAIDVMIPDYSLFDLYKL